MNIVGICRFSLLGRGDWKAYRDKSDDEVEAIAAEQAKILFAPERMEKRLATFEHLTLASLRAQTDQDFKFIVAASESMPMKYRRRLLEMCAAVPQVYVRFFELCDIGEAQDKVFAELGISLHDTLQFRLDDDDALSVNFVRKKREAAALLMPSAMPFTISFREFMFCAKGGEHAGVYNMAEPFLGVGVALRHPTKSVYAFGHFALPRRFTGITIPGGSAIVTHSGLNDTPFDLARIRRQKMTRMDETAIRKNCDLHFPFLSSTAKAIVGLEEETA